MLLNTLHEVNWRLSLAKASEIEITVTKWLYENLKAEGFEMNEINRNCSGHRTILIKRGEAK